jgi:hypothetical protein
MNKTELKIGDKVKIKANTDWLIGGLYHHCTKEFLIELFGEIVQFDKCFESYFQGEIIKIGKHNTYYIYDEIENKYFIMNNNHNEIYLLED